MKALVEYVAKAIVDQPDQVEVASADEAGELRLTLKVAEADKGKVIGKQGKVVKALRSLLSAAASKTNQRVGLEIA